MMHTQRLALQLNASDTRLTAAVYNYKTMDEHRGLDKADTCSNLKSIDPPHPISCVSAHLSDRGYTSSVPDERLQLHLFWRVRRCVLHPSQEDDPRLEEGSSRRT